MIDFYRELRLPAYNSSVPQAEANSADYPAGVFDPMLSVVLLAESLSRELDSRGGTLPSLSIEAGGSSAVRAYATSLHETVHWWQHIGSTTGLLTGLTTAAQCSACAGYLSRVDDRVAKPLLGVLQQEPRRVPEEHPAWLAALRWREAELGLAFMVDPVHAFYRVQDNSFLYESIGHSVVMHHSTVTWAMSQAVDPGGTALTSTDAWVDLYERSCRDQHDLFEVNALAEIPIGARDVFEGQARLIELQYRSRAVEPMTLPEARERGLLDGAYFKCLAHFLTSLERGLPDRIDGPLVTLFLLLCDIAINPAAGYPNPLPPDWDLVHGNHPGLRFLQLCAVARDHAQELLPRLKTVSPESYRACAAILCEPLRWPTPDEVARHACATLTSCAQAAEVKQERVAGEFGKEDTPIKLLLTEHWAFCEAKAMHPHFFCWPAHYLTVDGEPSAAVVEGQRLLDRFSPPFMASSPTSGVDSFALHGISGEQRHALASRYFMTQALYDLCAQWIARPGRFVFDYSWKRSMAADEVRRLKDSFRASFGRDLDGIPIA